MRVLTGLSAGAAPGFDALFCMATTASNTHDHIHNRARVIVPKELHCGWLNHTSLEISCGLARRRFKASNAFRAEFQWPLRVVACSVISVTHFVSAAPVVKSRCSRISWTRGSVWRPPTGMWFITESIALVEHSRQILRSLATGFAAGIEFVPDEPVPERRIIGVNVYRRVDQMGFLPVPNRDRVGLPFVKGLSGEFQYLSGTQPAARPRISGYVILGGHTWRGTHHFGFLFEKLERFLTHRSSVVSSFAAFALGLSSASACFSQRCHVRRGYTEVLLRSWSGALRPFGQPRRRHG